jgi:hypothetical protein
MRMMRERYPPPALFYLSERPVDVFDNRITRYLNPSKASSSPDRVKDPTLVEILEWLVGVNFSNCSVGYTVNPGFHTSMNRVQVSAELPL